MISELSLRDYLMGRIEESELSEEQRLNAATLLLRVNALMKKLNEQPIVNSGYRSPKINALAGGKLKSKHLICAAVDLGDKDGSLKKKMTLEILEEFDLYMEHPSATPDWCHLQCIAPMSGKRIFYP